MIVLGIDPGIEPALGVLRVSDEGIRVQTLRLLRERTVHRIGFVERLRSIVSDLNDEGAVVACVERVGAMPRQGVASVAHFCEAFGLIRGILAGSGVPCTLVTPMVWKRDLLAGYDMGTHLEGHARKKHQKAVAAKFVHDTYPAVNLIPRGCRTEDHNLAEAVCIATWRLRFGK